MATISCHNVSTFTSCYFFSSRQMHLDWDCTRMLYYMNHISQWRFLAQMKQGCRDRAASRPCFTEGSTLIQPHSPWFPLSILFWQFCGMKNNSLVFQLHTRAHTHTHWYIQYRWTGSPCSLTKCPQNLYVYSPHPMINIDVRLELFLL